MLKLMGSMLSEREREREREITLECLLPRVSVAVGRWGDRCVTGTG